MKTCVGAGLYPRLAEPDADSMTPRSVSPASSCHSEGTADSAVRCDAMTVTVTALAVVPVKGMRAVGVDALELGPRGPVGDRPFLVVDEANRLLMTIRTPALLQVSPRWDAQAGVLTLAFPGGSEVAAEPEPGHVGPAAG